MRGFFFFSGAETLSLQGEFFNQDRLASGKRKSIQNFKTPTGAYKRVNWIEYNRALFNKSGAILLPLKNCESCLRQTAIEFVNPHPSLNFSSLAAMAHPKNDTFLRTPDPGSTSSGSNSRRCFAQNVSRHFL